jgi:hypothetical protein
MTGKNRTLGCSQEHHRPNCAHFGYAGTYLSVHAKTCPCADPKVNEGCTCNPIYRANQENAMKNWAQDMFGKGPHLLTARNGAEALCGGPGICSICDLKEERRAIIELTEAVLMLVRHLKEEIRQHPQGVRQSYNRTLEAIQSKANVVKDRMEDRMEAH